MSASPLDRWCAKCGREIRLVRDANEPSHFVSFAEWDSLPAVTAWMELPDFDAKFDACSALCEQARGSRFTLTAQVL